MKTLLYIFLLFISTISGCKKEDNTFKLLQASEQLIPINADSASILLDSIFLPDKLSNENFAHWCMLTGKVTDETATGLLPVYQWKRAQKWFEEHGTTEEQARIALYLGRAYTEDGEYDKAMNIYTEALQFAEKHKENNIAGYICAYMADLYSLRDMSDESREKHEEAATLFKKAKNIKSYAYALKNLAIEWAFIDSFHLAMPFLYEADSVSRPLHNKNLSAAIANASGIICSMQGKYDEAENYHLKSINFRHNESIRDSIALLEIYIHTHKLDKAYAILNKIASRKDYRYSINNAYYMLYKTEKKYKEALFYKEICSDMLDSTTLAQNKMRILEIEQKYNNIKVREDNERLKNIQQKDLIIIIISLSLFLLSIATFIIYRQKAKKTLYKQEAELNSIRIELLNLSNELKEKKQLLKTAVSKAEDRELLQEEIEVLTQKYHLLQKRQLTTSSIGKKLHALVKKNILVTSQTLSNDKTWKALTTEVEKIYPHFYSLLKETCPSITEQEWQYCCLHIFGFDGNDEGKLLGINPDSVRMKRSRFKQRIKNKSQEDISLREILENILLE